MIKKIISVFSFILFSIICNLSVEHYNLCTGSLCGAILPISKNLNFSDEKEDKISSKDTGEQKRRERSRSRSRSRSIDKNESKVRKTGNINRKRRGEWIKKTEEEKKERLKKIDNAQILIDLPFLSKEKIEKIYDFPEDENKVIGEGGFGKVYEVSCKSNKKKYAIKVIEITTKTWNTILDEIKNQYTLSKDSEYFVKIYDVFLSEKFYNSSTSEYCYIVMELCEKDTLFEKIPQSRGIEDLKIVASYFYQLVSAVNYMHTNKYVHRDLKLENILFDSNGKLKIADFGFTKKISPKISERIEDIENSKYIENINGTFDYMNPEKIIFNFNRSDECKWPYTREDEYAIICILYAMIFGKNLLFLCPEYKKYNGGIEKHLNDILNNIDSLNDHDWLDIKNLFKEIFYWETLPIKDNQIDILNEPNEVKVILNDMMKSDFFKLGKECYEKNKLNVKFFNV